MTIAPVCSLALCAHLMLYTGPQGHSVQAALTPCAHPSLTPLPCISLLVYPRRRGGSLVAEGADDLEHVGHERQLGVRTVDAATSAHVRVWLAELKTRRNTDGRLVANAQQLAVVSDVARRVIQELDSTNNDETDADEPLRKIVHGGPGTGKTHAIKLLKELFEDVLGWQQGVHYQVVAFQAVMAHLIGGDTIHHALGIPVFTDGRSSEEQLASHMTVSKRMLQCRWLIIDEISMVSSQLLALVDIELHQVV